MLFLAVSVLVGLMASTLCKRASRAMALTIAFLFLLAFQFPFVAELENETFGLVMLVFGGGLCLVAAPFLAGRRRAKIVGNGPLRIAVVCSVLFLARNCSCTSCRP